LRFYRFNFDFIFGWFDLFSAEYNNFDDHAWNSTQGDIKVAAARLDTLKMQNRVRFLAISLMMVSTSSFTSMNPTHLARSLRRFGGKSMLFATQNTDFNLRTLDVTKSPIPKDLESGDHIVSVLSADGDVNIKVAKNTKVLAELIRRQNLSLLAADALGRAMACAALLSNGLKDEESIQFSFVGEGAIKGVLAIGDAGGLSRGTVGNPSVSLPLKNGYKLDVASAMGPGTLRVVKNHPDWLEPYSGIVEIKTGTIAEDIATYLHESEQRKTALGAGVAFFNLTSASPSAPPSANNTLESLAACGGFLVELLPGCSEEAAIQVEKNVIALVGKAESPASFLAAGSSPLDLAEELLAGLGRPKQVIASELIFHCPCTEDRLLRTLNLLPKEEVEEIVKNKEDVEATCQMCGKVYQISSERVKHEVLKTKQ